MTDAQLQPLFDLIREAVNTSNPDATVTISATALRLIAEELHALKTYQATLRAMVAAQAEDDGLWFVARYVSEGYLQQELRTLHLAVEQADVNSLSPSPSGSET